MNLIQNLSVKPGTRIILPGDEVNATILGLVLRRKDTAVELEIEALGCGTDYKRDPDRKLKYGTKIYPDLRDYPFALEVISKAKVSAGPTYYFFSKSIRESSISLFDTSDCLTGTNTNFPGSIRVPTGYGSIPSSGPITASSPPASLKCLSEQSSRRTLCSRCAYASNNSAPRSRTSLSALVIEAIST